MGHSLTCDNCGKKIDELNQMWWVNNFDDMAICDNCIIIKKLEEFKDG